MKIEVRYLSRNEFWQARIEEAREVAAEIMNTSEFLGRVANWAGFDNTAKSPAEIADEFRRGSVTISVGFYVNHIARAIAYEQPSGVFFNRAKLRRGAGTPGNVAHEVMHVLGYSHAGNARSGNENTVPYRIGDWVDGAEEWESGGGASSFAIYEPNEI